MSTRYNFAIGFNESMTKAEPTVEVIFTAVEAKVQQIPTGLVIGEEIEEFRFAVNRNGIESLIENLKERLKEIHKMENLVSEMELEMGEP